LAVVSGQLAVIRQYINKKYLSHYCNVIGIVYLVYVSTLSLTANCPLPTILLKKEAGDTDVSPAF